MSRAALFAVLALAGGCSSAPPPWAPVAHASPPLLHYGGGPLLLAPQIVTATFPGDARADAEAAYDDQLVSGAYWQAITAEYCDANGACIGAGRGVAHVALATPLDLSLDQADF